VVYRRDAGTRQADLGAVPPTPKETRSQPSGRTVVVAFSIAIVAAVALVAAALLLRDDGGSDSPPAQLVDLESIPQDGLTLGSPDATVTLIEYADFQCPFCRAYAVDVFPTVLEEYVRPGRVRSEYRGLAFLGPDSETALRYALAASLQDRFWQLQHALYAEQGDENSGWVTDELVRELAEDVPGLDVDRMFADADGNEVDELIDRANAQAQVDQVPGTPTFFVRIGDEEPYRIELPLEPDAFREALDDALRS